VFLALEDKRHLGPAVAGEPFGQGFPVRAVGLVQEEIANALFYRLTRSHKEHREKGMFPSIYKKTLCVLCVSV